MRFGPSASVAFARLTRLAGATAIAIAAAALLPQPHAAAQAPAAEATQGQMLLEADTLIYDHDAGTVTAAGNVQIDYNGTRLVADRVVYERANKRLIALGAVELVDRGGNRTFGDEINLSDDLRDGFVNALRIETSDRTFFAAESAERRDGNVTTLNSGVYTACEPCEEKPNRPPIWRVKAARIVWNGKEKIIRFERTRLEIFGLPIAYFPVLEIPDHTVKRKSGFLFPGVKFGSGALGFGISVPYYWALSPTYDVTATVTGLTKQGFLTDVEWRQRFNSGDYSIRAAGIYQLQPALFGAGTHGEANRLRGMIGSKGRFDINPRWAFGWRLLAQSDENFAYDYSIPGYSAHEFAQEIYLTGLNDRNYFDLRAYRFQIQESTTGAGESEILPWVLPLLDYSYTIDRAVAGGELSFDVNSQHVLREALYTAPTAGFAGQNIRGIQGSSARITAEAQWRKNIIVPGGLVVTPLLHARGDAIFTNYSAATQAAISTSTIGGVPVSSDLRPAYYRGMVTAGLEARWPFLFATRNSTHVVEPVAQIFARPDAPFDSVLGIPNEDAQSMVFDAGNLFERDKFSGYDEMEGGVRANVGIRYNGTFGTGWTVSATAGQSYHLAGYNSFGSPSLVNAGAFSGLETTRSDYVGAATLTAPRGNSLTVSSRLDETTLALRRIDVRGSTNIGPVRLGVGYAFIEAQPLYGFSVDRHQVSASARTRVLENWSAYGSAAYDLQGGNFVSSSIGFGYDDECFGFTFTASQSYGTGNTVTGRSFGVTISLRTIGDFGQTSSGLSVPGL